MPSSANDRLAGSPKGVQKTPLATLPDSTRRTNGVTAITRKKRSVHLARKRSALAYIPLSSLYAQAGRERVK